jgi:hypothetical protein
MNKIKLFWQRVASPLDQEVVPPLKYMLLDSVSAILAALFFLAPEIVTSLPHLVSYILSGILYILSMIILLGLLLRSKSKGFFNFVIRCDDHILYPMLYGLTPGIAFVELLKRVIENHLASLLIYPFFIYLIVFVMAGGSLAIRWDRKDLLALQCKVGAMLFVVFAIISLFPTIHASGIRPINTTDLTNSIILLFLSLILQISVMIIEYKYLKQK